MPPRAGRSSPAVRRILREAKELAERDPDIYAAPAEVCNVYMLSADALANCYILG